MNDEVKFKPHGTYLLVQIPEGAVPAESESGIIVPEAVLAGKRKEYIEGGDKMQVKATGSDCKFARVNDFVSISIRGSMELVLDECKEPFIVIRESEILGKYK